MADIAIETNTSPYTRSLANRGGIFWTSSLVGYVIYVAGADPWHTIVYRKTTDGGGTWGSPVDISAEASDILLGYDCWADWQTPGDSGTKIHIVFLDNDEATIWYRCLDTSTDTMADMVELISYGEGVFNSQISREHASCSITKSRGGKLAIAYRVTNSEEPEAQLEGFYVSSNGIDWASKTVPFEDAEDYIQLYCGNEIDNDDLWAAFWDRSANEISLKTYDDSGNSWSEQSIASNMDDSGTFLLMDGQVRLSDGHLIFAAWTDYGFSGTQADLKVWDINGASSITAKTSVITNEAENFLVSIFINQINDDIYISYAQGTAILSQVAISYKKSTDGGANWGSETAMQADAEDDEQWVSAGCMKSAGKFMPVWFNDDLDDIFCNVDNAISLYYVSPFPTHFNL